LAYTLNRNYQSTSFYFRPWVTQNRSILHGAPFLLMKIDELRRAA